MMICLDDCLDDSLRQDEAVLPKFGKSGSDGKWLAAMPSFFPVENWPRLKIKVARCSRCC